MVSVGALLQAIGRYYECILLYCRKYGTYQELKRNLDFHLLSAKQLDTVTVQGVEFWAINTDAQALVHSAAPQRLQIGQQITRGLGEVRIAF